MTSNPEAAVSDAQAQYDLAQEAAAEAHKALLAAQAVLDAAIEERDGTPAPHQDQIDRMVYIRSQAEQRAARAGVAEHLRQYFPDGELPKPRSTLDEAMKGSRKRGQNRPRRAE